MTRDSKPYEKLGFYDEDCKMIRNRRRNLFIIGGIVLSTVYFIQYSHYEFEDSSTPSNGGLHLPNNKNLPTIQREYKGRGKIYPRGVVLKINKINGDSGWMCTVAIAIILCQDSPAAQKGTNYQHEDSSPATDFSRQINQTVVMLKSIALLTKFNSETKDSQCVNVIILSDTKGHYKTILKRIDNDEKWSEDFRKRIKFSYVPVKYPAGAQWMRKLFRPCATLRLFLAELLPNYDSIIYLDTDIIFFQSVQNLWSEFKKFSQGEKDSSAPIAAMAPCLFHYGTKQNEIPYYGKSGLNAGIMLMNLTRMRNTLWTHKIRMVTTMFQTKIKLADQDILNIYFHFFPEHLHLLSCDWNFRPFQCRNGGFCQDPAISKGISALHGNALSFTSKGQEPLFHTVYETFRKIKLYSNFSLEYFVEDLNFNLIESEEVYRIKATASECTNWGMFTSLALRRLERLLKKTENEVVVEKVLYYNNDDRHNNSATATSDEII